MTKSVADMLTQIRDEHRLGLCKFAVCPYCQAERNACAVDSEAAESSTRRFPRDAKKVPVNLRLTEGEKAALQALADTYTGGNLSKWLLEAGTGYRPPRKSR